jgi:hypothetical protein
MTGNEVTRTGWRGGVGTFFGRTAAVVIGLGLMIAGVGMGVTVVLLPVGILTGAAGVALLAGAVLAQPEPG